MYFLKASSWDIYCKIVILIIKIFKILQNTILALCYTAYGYINIILNNFFSFFYLFIYLYKYNVNIHISSDYYIFTYLAFVLRNFDNFVYREINIINII